MTAATPRTVEQYLDLLRAELQGADPALVQDALYDAEEHLRAELAQNPGETEETMLGRIVASYGAPAEVADAYRTNEARVQAALRTPPPKAMRTAIGRFFAVYTDPRAYLSIAYMLLALATGILYFVFAVTGSALTAGLAILIIGVPFFLLFIGTARVLALAEGRIVESMLGVRMPRRPVHPGPQVSWWTRIVEMIKDPRTWGTLVYLVAMLPLGIFYFTFAVVGVVVSLALFISPIAVLLHLAGVITIDGQVQGPDAFWLPLISILGIVLLTITLHLSRGIGYLHGQFAKFLLVRPAPTVDEVVPA
ncbi:MAG TPA: sensor domain-containing protein [Steroidobacteraceae bacterium]|nr:sensor domain-containing protein [Steroidobacteraceae bacterium]